VQQLWLSVISCFSRPTTVSALHFCGIAVQGQQTSSSDNTYLIFSDVAHRVTTAGHTHCTVTHTANASTALPWLCFSVH
jgi:hypothetical protein